MLGNFSYSNPTRLYFGENSLNYLNEELPKYGKNVLLVYGGGSIKKNGIYDKVMEILKANGKNIFEDAGVMPNPTVEKLYEGCRRAKEGKVDLILAVGGGSVSGTLSSSGAGTGGSCARYRVPSCLRLPMEAINSSSSIPSVFTFLLPMLIEI